MNINKRQQIIILLIVLIIGLFVMSKIITPVKYAFITTTFSMGLILFVLEINKTRPVGITIIGVATILYGIFAKSFIAIVFLVSFVIYKFNSLIYGKINSEAEALYTAFLGNKIILLYATLGFTFLITLYTCIGIGMLKLKKWARYLTFIVVVYELYSVAYPFVKPIRNFLETGEGFYFPMNFYTLYTLVIAIACFIIIYYLTRHKVKEQFR